MTMLCTCGLTSCICDESAAKPTPLTDISKVDEVAVRLEKLERSIELLFKIVNSLQKRG